MTIRQYVPSSKHSLVNLPPRLDKTRPRMIEIIVAVAAADGVTPDDILGRRCTARPSLARHKAMWLARTGGRSLTQIGRRFRRDHTTVSYGCWRIARLMVEQPGLLDPVLERLSAAGQGRP